VNKVRPNSLATQTVAYGRHRTSARQIKVSGNSNVYTNPSISSLREGTPSREDLERERLCRNGVQLRDGGVFDINC
jgi:hypothetical protein